MAFTSKLGSALCKLGNIKLSLVGENDTVLTIAGIASFSAILNYVFTAQLGTYRSQPEFLVPGFGSADETNHFDSLTVAGVASVSRTGNVPYQNSITITATDAMTLVIGQFLSNSLTISATDSFSAVSNFVTGSVSLSATSATTIAPQFVLANSLVVTVTDSVTIATIVQAVNAATLTSIDAFVIFSGQTYLNQIQCLVTSSVSLLPGVGYSSSLTLNVTSSDTFTMTGGGDDTVTTSVTASAVLDSRVDWNPIQPVSGVASTSLIINGDYLASKSLNTTGFLYPEGLYNYVAATAFSSHTETYVSNPLSNVENPAATSGFSISSSVVFNRTVGQTITFAQNARIKPLLQRVSQTFAVAQALTNANIYNKTIVHTLTMAQQAYRLFPALQTITFTAQATMTRAHVKIVNQTFLMTQAILKTGVIARTANNTLVMKQGYNRPLPFNTIGGQYVAPIPAVYAAVVKQKCSVTIGVPDRVIVLPCPQLGDSQSYSGTLNLKRSMTGNTITYVRRSRFNHLKYSWWLGRQKSLELEDFILNFSDQFVTLYNWKGETWVGYITNSPYEFVAKERYQPTGERIEVTLDFEVVKVGG